MSILFSYDPRLGIPVGPAVPKTTPDELERILDRAQRAAPLWRTRSDAERAHALRAIADALDASAETLVEIADQETALGRPRLTGEVARTTAQLRMFATIVENGSYVDVVISPKAATGGADVRRMLIPIGPVAVFSASNFPFAFSVAGGDTASALAVGCPVVVKAHEGHPVTSAAVADIMQSALDSTGAPEGVVGIIFGPEVGGPLVRHPSVKAVGFTGSTRGGRALFDLATRRPDPIPFYGELGSVNPVVVLPGAASARAAEIADGYAASLTLGVGQFCTNPNLLFVPSGSELGSLLPSAIAHTDGGVMLTERVHGAYEAALADSAWRGLDLVASGSATEGPWAATPEVRTVAARDVTPEVAGIERFGPAGLVITYDDVDEVLSVLAGLDGSLTATIHSDDCDTHDAARVTDVLATRAGRLVMNGWPTGVGVCWAMHHGGPWPATTSPTHTSVGGAAVRRWLIPIAYQDYPDRLLPEQLRRDNPRGLSRSTQPVWPS